MSGRGIACVEAVDRAARLRPRDLVVHMHADYSSSTAAVVGVYVRDRRLPDTHYPVFSVRRSECCICVCQ